MFNASAVHEVRRGGCAGCIGGIIAPAVCDGELAGRAVDRAAWVGVDALAKHHTARVAYFGVARQGGMRINVVDDALIGGGNDCY